MYCRLMALFFIFLLLLSVVLVSHMVNKGLYPLHEEQALQGSREDISCDLLEKVLSECVQYLCVLIVIVVFCVPPSVWHEEADRKLSQNSLGQDQAKTGSRTALNRRVGTPKLCPYSTLCRYLSYPQHRWGEEQT